MRNIIWLGALLVSFAFAGAALAGAGNIYSVRCAACHGQKGEGADIGPALKDNEFITKGKAEDIKKVIIDGRDGAAKKYKQFPVGMPSYPEFDGPYSDVAELIRFLQCGLQTDPELIAICASKDIIRIEAESVAQNQAELAAQKRVARDIEKLTLFIFVGVDNLDSSYKNKPRYISGVKEIKELAKKISKDSQLKNKILEETKLHLKSWNKQIIEEHTAFVDITLEPSTGLGATDIIFKVNPSVSVSIAKGRHGMKSFKSLLSNGKLKKVGGTSSGFLYDSNVDDDTYNKMVYSWVKKAGTDLASYFPKVKEEETK